MHSKLTEEPGDEVENAEQQSTTSTSTYQPLAIPQSIESSATDEPAPAAPATTGRVTIPPVQIWNPNSTRRWLEDATDIPNRVEDDGVIYKTELIQRPRELELETEQVARRVQTATIAHYRTVRDLFFLSFFPFCYQGHTIRNR